MYTSHLISLVYQLFSQSDIVKMVKHMFLKQILEPNVYQNGGVNSGSAWP